VKIGNDRDNLLDARIKVHKEHPIIDIYRKIQAKVNRRVELQRFSTTC
jgi:hypothetical protein